MSRCITCDTPDCRRVIGERSDHALDRLAPLSTYRLSLPDGTTYDLCDACGQAAVNATVGRELAPTEAPRY